MYLGHKCQFLSIQCNIWEITEILMDILVSFFIQPLFPALNFYIGIFHEIFDLLIQMSAVAMAAAAAE